jgi:hypothetical protein
MSIAEVSRPADRKPADSSRADALARVTEAAVEAFERDGAVWIPGLLAPAWVRLIAQGVQRNLNNPGPHAFTAFAGQPGAYHQDYGNFPITPEYQRLLADSPLVDAMARLLRTEKLWLFVDQIFVKEGGASRPSPWHQDIPWTMADGRQLATMWIATQPLEADETLEYVAGSFRGPVYDHTPVREGAMEDTRPATPAPRLPDIEADRAKWPIVTHASRPGDVLVFHPQTLHGGGGMRAGGSRRSLSLRFFGDDVCYVEREAGHDPQFPGVAERLRHGDLLRDPWFPQAYPRGA